MNRPTNGRTNGHAADPLDPADLECAKAVRRAVDGRRILDATRDRVVSASPWGELLLTVSPEGLTPEERERRIKAHLKGLGRREPDLARAMQRALDAATVAVATEPDEAGAAAFRLAIMGSAAFASAEYRREWLIKKIVASGQPCVVGGPRKALKTTVMVDMVISLGDAKPFLGEFEVPRPLKVLFLSGESGAATIQETARRICRAKGLGLADLDGQVFWGFDLPQLSNPEQLDALAAYVRGTADRVASNGIDIVVIDPLYLCLLSGGARIDAANLFDIGPLLARITATFLDAGATPFLVHHLRKNRDNPEAPPELEDLAYAGVQEFARQWILLGRRSAYEPGTGEHRLWLNVGGSAGHSGAWALDVSEGVIDEDFGGREWGVRITGASTARDEARAQTEAAKAERQAERSKARDQSRSIQLQRDAREAYAALAKLGPSTAKAWRVALNWDGDRLDSVIYRLSEDGQIRRCQVSVACGKGGKGSRSVDGWEVVREAPDVQP